MKLSPELLLFGWLAWLVMIIMPRRLVDELQPAMIDCIIASILFKRTCENRVIHSSPSNFLISILAAFCAAFRVLTIPPLMMVLCPARCTVYSYQPPSTGIVWKLNLLGTFLMACVFIFSNS